MPTYKVEDIIKEYEDSEEVESNFEKFKAKPKKAKIKGGHVSTHGGRSNNVMFSFGDFLEETNENRKASKPSVSVNNIRGQRAKINDVDLAPNKGSLTPKKEPFVPQFGPNTKEIKGFKIDFDRLANIELSESEHDGHQSFGIKFTFTGKKQSFRIIWYGRNQQERDKVFAEEYKFWKSLGY